MTSAPLLYNPLTKMSEHWFNHQFSQCGDLELDFYRCVSRVGYGQFHLNKVCSMEYEDFKECASKIKQNQRYIAMHAERAKQGRQFMERPPDHSAKVIR